MLKYILIPLFLLFSNNPLFAYDKTIQWSTWDDGVYIDHYKVYWGSTSGEYTNESEAIPSNQTIFSVTDLTDGTPYYFAVKSFDVNGNESFYSNEIGTFSILEPEINFVANESNYQSYAFSGVGLANTTVELFGSDLSNPVASTIVGNDGIWSANLDFSEFPQGSVEIKVTHAGEEQIISGLYDTVAPDAPFSVLFETQ